MTKGQSWPLLMFAVLIGAVAYYGGLQSKEGELRASSGWFETWRDCQPVDDFGKYVCQKL